ncbi:UvrD-helicase domain-containing protein [Ichthyenterobacterium sp. W332]|uniref:DNA 3'-5' helicase n=1 Tax=Microcosmobacter mediterraneus TaxID=3075607 RepID=A0ABU2YIE8_9FLAO|nr:UvrD-helicase domain-containing protein [Ichthyenterobacterium sp. W332]MDT0557947.1 UvrD-helicase domain-containing protein [Ichthyenterobacterium sp. W332]
MSFTIYNASAGSGKTFTLVKQYLKLILSAKNPLYFKYVLALTFTNKAVNEMKSRILENLKTFSKLETSVNSDPMFKVLSEELNMTSEDLRSKSKLILETILHNYASFDVSTIDKFNHRLIRTFAHDLQLPGNFEVELDQDSLLQKAVENLLLKAGEDEVLTKLLVDFSIEKADDDKSWDIGYDFKKIAKLLVNENDLKHVDDLKHKTLKDFGRLRTYLSHKIAQVDLQIVSEAESALTLIDESGLEFNDFSGSYLPKHFSNLAYKKYNINFEAKWQNDIETKVLYPKRVTNDIAEVVKAIQPQLAKSFKASKLAVFNFKFLNAIYKTITPLSVLNAINTELNRIKEEDNKLLISEFNTIISNEIKDQPTPYIYERLGEKYKHYFIDEFQDTSQLQWQNLQPLVSNALEQEQFGDRGSLLLVGDAKQAIYRWRGGYAEQFINLFNKTEHPFSIEQNLVNLNTNYRSSEAVVNFNNGFFNYIANHLFSNQVYSNLYKDATQKPYHSTKGYVNIEFLDLAKDDDKYLLYSEKVYDRIIESLELGYHKKDISVLVRRKAEGLAISEYLSSKGVSILSSETLLLKNSDQVRFINNVLKFIVEPEDLEAKIVVLQFISKRLKIENPHNFFKEFINEEQESFFKELNNLGFTIEFKKLQLLSLYDLVELLIRTFIEPKNVDAYLQSYLNEVFSFSEKKGNDINGFLEYFQLKDNNLAITSAEALDAVKIMTIHKSKGLEFPVVIYPFAEIDIYREKDAKTWFPLSDEDYEGFEKTLINYNKDIKYFGAVGEQIYNSHQAELELDNINLLYVTLTRAKEQLYIISKLDVNKNQEPNTTTYAGHLINYLQKEGLWDANKVSYSFGAKTNKTTPSLDSVATTVQDEFISCSISEHDINIVTKSGLLWDTTQQKAIERGNLIHDIMANIITQNDIVFVLNRYVDTGKIDKNQYKVFDSLITEICTHPKLCVYFNNKLKVYNEKDIMTDKGEFIRPDKLVMMSENTSVLIDYKTGEHNVKHDNQLLNYQKIIEQMGVKVLRKILIYINEEVTIKEF